MTIALAAIVLKQHLSSPQLAGAALVVAAIVAMQLRRRPKPRLVEQPVAMARALEPGEQLAAAA